MRGVLGHGDEQDQPQLKVIEALRGKKVVQVSAGVPQHGAAGGRGGADLRQREYGQLGHGDTQDQLLPKVVEALRGKKVLQISAGASTAWRCWRAGRC